METLFQKIKSFFGKASLLVLHGFNKVDAEVDAADPEVVALLTEGASVASLIPGIAAPAAGVLNAGLTLLGAAKAALDGTVAVEPQVLAQIKALAPAGYSLLLIENDVKSDVETLLKEYEAEFEAAKGAVTTITGEIAPKPIVKAAVAGFGGGSNLTQSAGGEPLNAEAKTVAAATKAKPLLLIKGAVTSGEFRPSETISQEITGATAIIVASTADGLTVETVTGPPDAHPWKSATGSVFTPTALPEEVEPAS